MASWSRVAKAIQARLQSVTGVGTIHDSMVYTDEAATGNTFRKYFVSNNRVNFGWITRKPSFTERSIAVDDGTLTIVRGVADIEYFTALDMSQANNEKLAYELFDRILEAFDRSDRTLGGVVNTHSLPEGIETESKVDFQGIICHRLNFRIRYEYIDSKDITQEVLTPESVSGQYAEVEKIGRGLVDIIKPYVVPVVVPDNSRVILARTCGPSEKNESVVYPGNPRVDLPRIVFRVEEWTLAPGEIAAGQTSDFGVIGSFWVQLPQALGQDHNGRLIRAVERISQPFLGNFNPAGIVSIPGLISWKCQPAVSAVFDEQSHPWEDPTLRVSVGRVQIQVNGRIRIK